MKRRYFGMDACWYDDEDDAFDRTRAHVIRWVPRSLAFIVATAALLYACTPASADTAGPYIPGGNDPHIPAPVPTPAALGLSLLALGSLALLRRKV